MKTWNSVAVVLVIMVALQITLGSVLEFVAVEWRLHTSWTSSDTTRLLYMFRVVPITAIHLGFAYWLHARATRDGKNATLWMVFGLCFSLMAGILYISLELARNLGLISESKDTNVVAVSSDQ
jgi:hypothetical protein